MKKEGMMNFDLVDNDEEVIYTYFMSWTDFDSLSVEQLRRHAHALLERLKKGTKNGL